MKKIRIPLLILGLFSLLIPIGIAAQYILAVKTQHEPSPTPSKIASGFIPLIFGVAFIYIGIRLPKILSDSPRLPILTMRAWIGSNLASVAIGLMIGHGINPIGLVCIAAIYWYFSWALMKKKRTRAEPVGMRRRRGNVRESGRSNYVL